MRKTSSTVKYTALIGMMAASIECAKLALAAVPNVEAVSLLIYNKCNIGLLLDKF